MYTIKLFFVFFVFFHEFFFNNEVRMFGNPFLESDTIPQNEKTARQYREEKPKEDFAPQLMSFTVEIKISAIDNRMLRVPSLYHTECPRRTNRQREYGQQERENTDTD